MSMAEHEIPRKVLTIAAEWKKTDGQHKDAMDRRCEE